MRDARDSRCFFYRVLQNKNKNKIQVAGKRGWGCPPRQLNWTESINQVQHTFSSLETVFSTNYGKYY